MDRFSTAATVPHVRSGAAGNRSFAACDAEIASLEQTDAVIDRVLSSLRVEQERHRSNRNYEVEEWLQTLREMIVESRDDKLAPMLADAEEAYNDFDEA